MCFTNVSIYKQIKLTVGSFLVYYVPQFNVELNLFLDDKIKGTVQRDLRGVKSGFNR
jgi:hypothetical protein